MRARFLGPCVALALLVSVSGAWAQSTPATPATDAQSIATLNEQAANGDAKAQCGVGDAYAKGEGVPQDYAEASVWYRKAADQDYAQPNTIFATFTTLATVYRKTTHRPQSGAARLPIRGMPEPNLISLGFTPMAKESRRITLRPPSGTAKRLIRVMPKRRQCSADSTIRAKA